MDDFKISKYLCSAKIWISQNKRFIKNQKVYIYIQLHECYVNKSSWMAISTHTHTKHTHKQNIFPTSGLYLVIYTTQYFPNHSPFNINIDYINNQVTIYA